MDILSVVEDLQLKSGLHCCTSDEEGRRLFEWFSLIWEDHWALRSSLENLGSLLGLMVSIRSFYKRIQ